MSEIKQDISPLKRAIPTLDIDELERAMTLKYYDDSIVINSNEIINLYEYDIEDLKDTGYSLKLPSARSVYYYNDNFANQYNIIEGSKTTIEKGYLDKLNVINVKVLISTGGSIKVKPYIVEYFNSEIIDILEMKNNEISFQPNDQTDEFEILLKIEGEGILYNIEIINQKSQRQILNQKNFIFTKDDFFLNENLVKVKESDSTNDLNLNIVPNQQKHIYVSYLEKNNKYSTLPHYSIFEGVDLSSNVLIEFNIVKDETLEFIPMLIEYSKTEKIGIKNLNAQSTEIYSLKTGTENVRLAFRFAGYGNMQITNVRIVSLEELPRNDKLNFQDRNEVVKLLSPSMHLKEFKVACIMDEFTYNSFNPEVNLYRLDNNKWKSEMLFVQPDLLFIESAWVGNEGKWHRKVAYYDDEQHKDIRELIDFAQNLNIPVVFWNKEDPVHYDRFIETAKLCDFVFTTDQGRVSQYIKDCGHKNVEALPFAAQPKNHNPIKIQNERDSRVSFAGSYYRHHEERSKDMDLLLEASKEIGLVIYDRNYDKTRSGQMPNHKFPERYEPYIKGTLPFNLIDKSYKGYKFMINVNTVKHSETMFSRRVFEGLLSGTPIISTFSLGMKNMFGDIINASNNILELKEHLVALDSDQELYNKYALRGVREVLLHHTYEDRMMRILNKVGYTILSSKTNVKFIAFVDRDQEIDKYVSIFESQSISNKKLVIIHKNIVNYQKFYNNYNTENIIGIDYKALKKYINLKQLLGDGFLLVLNQENFYSSNYALDLILANSYSEADIIGKAMYYTYEGGSLEIVNKNLDYIYTPDIKVDRAAIDISVFDKFSVLSALKYLEREEELAALAPFGVKSFSGDSLNFIENGMNFNDKEIVQI